MRPTFSRISPGRAPPPVRLRGEVKNPFSLSTGALVRLPRALELGQESAALAYHREHSLNQRVPGPQAHRWSASRCLYQESVPATTLDWRTHFIQDEALHLDRVSRWQRSSIPCQSCEERRSRQFAPALGRERHSARIGRLRRPRWRSPVGRAAVKTRSPGQRGAP